MIKQNIGIVNSLVRITFGLTMLCWACAKYVKTPWRDSLLLVIFASAMKVGEGILRFCPITFMFENYQEEKNEEKEISFNPS
ncbi:YgaP family membrane protein [Bacillus alveayuensis]|jgi:hypothetical protein|uniref:Inner membrane protein YgaP-like transmembrane domain-containing protein n=1 Tax=Aeribacillus alveayuensis TaxID=279215 RepID=A0ABT9VQH0_9BACI|nr:DUF2892 domain-containing protein [Bacillus alveayuensis]MDQ0163224.1 hypothetical protein [Bacillus alveayuensis]